jgi:hypothetical protein
MAFNYSPKIVTDGLVLYLDAANPKSYVSGSTAWNDISRGGNNGTLVNGPTFNSANGGSIMFDGVNDYTSIPYTPILAPTSSLTISTWASASWNSLVGQKSIVSKTQTGGYQLSVNEGTYYPSGLGTIFYLGGAYRSASLSTSLVSNGWHHIVSTFDGQYVRLYLDGVERANYNYGSIVPITYNNNNHLVIAAEPGFGTGVDGQYFPGKIAQTQIYNRALSSQEVLQNYNATKTRFGL